MKFTSRIETVAVRVVAALALLALSLSTASAGTAPRSTAWGQMYKREDATIRPLMAKWALPDYAYGYCLAEMNVAHDDLPKTGLAPFGIPSWDQLSDDQFWQDLRALEQWQTGFMVRCLADFKGKLDAAH